VLNIYSRILKLHNGAAINAGLVGWLGQPLHVAEERRVQRQDAPMDAKLHIFGLQDDATIAMPDV
jgi:hypothetical protein